MATTLTSAGEITYASFPIEKMETNEDGDLVIYGKASGGDVDADAQIVDPAWMAKAVQDWLQTGANLRVQHNAQRDPAGIGLEAHTTDNGDTYVKGLVVEPIAKKLVSKGVLRSYSVGIARPTIERDVTGKARGGVIRGGSLVEISLVDRPALASAKFQLVKSANDGSAEFTGQLFGETAEIQKALAGPAVAEAVNNIDKFEAPADISIDFTPNDLMKILQEKMVAQAQKRDFDRNVGGGVDRDKLPDSDFAGRNRSFPIVTQADVSDALHSIGRAGPDNYSHDELKRRILEIAHRKGFSVPDEDSSKSARFDPDHDGDNDATPSGDTDHDYWSEDGKQKKPVPGHPMGEKADEPDVTKKPEKKAKKKAKKMPPWLSKPADDDSSMRTEKYQDPKSASGAVGDAEMSPAPEAELQETPAPAHMKAAAILRYKTLGIDTDLGILHDLTCEAFHPDDVAKYHPGMDLSAAINENVWQERALHAVTSRKSSLTDALEAQQVVQAAITLKNADRDELRTLRIAAYKAFRDANPGPSSFPTPGSISPEKFRRGSITAGHAAEGSGHDGPTTSPHVASGAPSAGHFDRPPLGAGHQTPSPSFMKNTHDNFAQEQGTFRAMGGDILGHEKTRRAMTTMHDHLSRMFPGICSVEHQDDPYRVENVPSVPPAQGLSVKSEDDGVLASEYKFIRKLEKKVRDGKITEAEARDRLSRKTAEKYARDLAKQVEKGLTSKDAVLRALGVTEAKPAANAAPAPEPVVVQKAAVPEVSGITPDIMKSMMTEILKPFEEKLNAQNEHISTQNQLLNEYQEKFAEQEKELAEQRSRWDALANQPDPSSAAFTGLAVNPLHQRPAVTKQEDINKRAQGMMMRQLERAWRTSENPAEREAAYKALMEYKGNIDL